MMENQEQEIEMPAPSYWPIVMAFGLLLIAAGIIYSLIISAVGIIILLVALVGWTLENRSDIVVFEEVDVPTTIGKEGSIHE